MKLYPQWTYTASTDSGVIQWPNGTNVLLQGDDANKFDAEYQSLRTDEMRGVHCDQYTEVAKVDRDSLDPFTKAYIEALFFTEEDRLQEYCTLEVPDGCMGAEHLSDDAIKTIAQDCSEFQAMMGSLWEGKSSGSGQWTIDEQAGHDYWLTRNGHGAGFWDRPEKYGALEADELTRASDFRKGMEAYVSDTGRIEVMCA